MKQTRNHYSESFKQQVLDDYFQSGMNQVQCAAKWQIKRPTLTKWLGDCTTEKKVVPSLPNQKFMNPTDQALENLRLENEKLRREVEYQKLKVAGYEQLLEIVNQEDGIDLLKKDGATGSPKSLLAWGV